MTLTGYAYLQQQQQKRERIFKWKETTVVGQLRGSCTGNKGTSVREFTSLFGILGEKVDWAASLSLCLLFIAKQCTCGSFQPLLKMGINI
jgi:hypothetical protein